MGNSKKKIAIIAVIVAAVIVAVSLLIVFTREKGERVDPNKTQIYVGYYNGGLGETWFSETKKAFEAKFTQYQVMPVPGKSVYDSSTLLNNYSSYTQDIFFLDYCGSGELKQFYTNDYVADMHDIVNEKLTEFGEEKSIMEKMAPAVQGYYDMDGKVFALPWYQASYQMIYDVKLFREKSLFVDEAGAWNEGSAKSKGQDGKAGTYDDGLPVTFSDFFKLLDKMIDLDIIPMTFYASGAYYFTSYLTNMFADYEGYNDFMLNYVLEGTDSDLGEVTLENAYRLKNEQKGKKYILEFAKQLVTTKHGAKNYYSDNSFQTSHDNFAAQDEFLMSYELSKEKGSKAKPVAMLVDGPWWEKEASLTMDALDERYPGKGQAYGTREFGIMPMPEADDGTSADGNTISCTSGRSLIMMNKNSKNKEAAGKYLQFCCSEEGLRIATAYSNILRPYEYEMTQEYLDMMTPYGRSVYEYNQSSEVVFSEVPIHEFLRAEGASYCSYLQMMVSTEDTTANIAQYFLKDGATVEKFLAGLANEPKKWKDLVEEYSFRVGA